MRFLATWGISENESRLKSLLKSKLSVSTEGWIGLICRLGAALDEVGVLIETGYEVVSLLDNKVNQGWPTSRF